MTKTEKEYARVTKERKTLMCRECRKPFHRVLYFVYNTCNECIEKRK